MSISQLLAQSPVQPNKICLVTGGQNGHLVSLPGLTERAINVKLCPLPQPGYARTYAEKNPSTQRATQLKSELAQMYSVTRQNINITTVP
jgi:hypothetical protein